MMKTKHTPGPWTLDNLGTDIKIQASGAVEAIALVHDQQSTHGAEANAHLMSAAPEMLEALEKLLLLSDVALKQKHSLDCSIRRAARDAIRKAKGENS